MSEARSADPMGGDTYGELRTVGRYEVIRPIARGGMAAVFLARHLELDREVALKELSTFRSSDRSMVQRFLQESRLAGSMSHPNIVTVHDYFEQDAIPYIAMEYVSKGSLRAYCGHLDFAQIVGVLEGVLAGLAHAETKKVVHRDLKPENIMVTADGRVKIADFGIAKATEVVSTRAFVTATGTTIGTPTYMAPEQAMARPVGPWTDLYSVGVIAYELLVGHPPYHDIEAPMAVLFAHVNQPIVPPSEVVPELDPVLSRWVEQLLAKDPSQRTAGAFEAWDALEEIAIDLLGPRWRRGARIAESRTLAPGAARPLTPSPFRISPLALPAVPNQPTDDYMTYEPVSGRPAQAAPPPAVVARHQPPSAPVPAAQPLAPLSVADGPLRVDEPRLIEVDGPTSGGPEGPALSDSQSPGAEATANPVDDPPRPASSSDDPRPRRPAIRRARWMLLTTLGVAAAAIVVIARSAGAPGRQPPQVARSGLITMAYRAPWRATGEGGQPSFITPTMAGLAPGPAGQPPIVLTSGGASVVAGLVAGADAEPGAPPPALVALYGRPLSATNTSIEGAPAMEYRWSATPTRRLVALVLPTTRDDVVIVCSTALPTPRALDECVRTGRGARISGAQLLPPGPDLTLASAVRAALAPMMHNRSRITGLTSRRLQARGRFAQTLGSAAATSAEALRHLSVPPRYRAAISSLASALSAERVALTTLARAAHRNERAGYSAASKYVAQSSAAAASALSRLEASGIPASSLPVITPPPPPAPARAHPRPDAHTPTPAHHPNPSAALGPTPAPLPTPTPTPSPAPRPTPAPMPTPTPSPTPGPTPAPTPTGTVTSPSL